METAEYVRPAYAAGRALYKHVAARAALPQASWDDIGAMEKCYWIERAEVVIYAAAEQERLNTSTQSKGGERRGD
jgi:hypothetical protein